MSSSEQRTDPGAQLGVHMRLIGRGRGRWLTARGLLSLGFVALLLAGCVTLLAIVYIFMSTVPTYHFGDVQVGSPILTPTSVTGTVQQSSVTTAAAAPFSIASQSGVLETLLWVSLVALAGILLAGAGASWLVAGRVLRPLRRINHAAQLAGSGSLTHRIGLDGPPDEITELSRTFDAMLERLDTAFQAHQRFAANASHELQTPLSATKTMLEVAAADPASVDLPRLITQLRETNGRSISTVEALLDLADADRRDIDREPVDLGVLVATALRDVQPDIDRQRLSVRFEPCDGGPVIGDRVLLRQVAANLVGNAVRHNVEAGSISISVLAERATGHVQLSIVNSGPPITDAALASLTEPFFQAAGRVADSSTQHRGHGLGLALVRDIVIAHQGVLRLTANETGGLTVAVHLPGWRPPDSLGD